MLFATLPRHYDAEHWQLAWGGFDIGLGLALAGTAVTVARRSPLAEVAATVTGTLLVCDAWFDVSTSREGSDVLRAAALALAIELPIAALCFWMAGNFARAFTVARPFLQAGGFTIVDNQLVPPRVDSGDLSSDSDLFGVGVRSMETQSLIKGAMERGFQTRDAEMELGEMLGDLGDAA